MEIEFFVTYDIAKKLKELGFAEPCAVCWNEKEVLISFGSIFRPSNYNTGWGSNISAPLWQQVIDWLREKHGYHFELIPDEETGEWYCISYFMLKMSETDKKGPFKTYSEARGAAILNALENIL